MFIFFFVPLLRNEQFNICMRNFITIFFLLVVLTACHKSVRVVESNSEVITIDSTFDSIQDTTYLLHITPIKDMLKKQLDMPIGYAPKPLPVYQPECPMLNWASDALFTVTKQLYPKQVDMAVVNIGGMRCEWASGDITFRNVFELMPFDNELVVLTLSGKEILALCDIFAKHGGEGVAGLRMVAKNGVLKSVTIAGKEVIPEVYYTIATSDYLSQGNDGMTPLRNYIEIWKSNKKIRDLYIEYIKQVEVVESEVDGRMDI